MQLPMFVEAQLVRRLRIKPGIVAAAAAGFAKILLLNVQRYQRYPVGVVPAGIARPDGVNVAAAQHESWPIRASGAYPVLMFAQWVS